MALLPVLSVMTATPFGGYPGCCYSTHCPLRALFLTELQAGMARIFALLRDRLELGLFAPVSVRCRGKLKGSPLGFQHMGAIAFWQAYKHKPPQPKPKRFARL